jgi:2'-hydroxyisoflavone reductase
MKVLIIGGTQFVGRHLVAAALSRGHEVTRFNRGRHLSALSANVETIRGDRNIDLAKLKGRSWDVVIDTCGYLPHNVTAAAEALADSIDRYVFISSISAYADLSRAGIEETAPLATLTSEQLADANAIDSSGDTSAMNYGKLYGGLKALCEQAVEAGLPERSLIIRPGVIVGPDDYTDRFTYWVVRLARGGEVLAPDRPARRVQFIDVRDLAGWIVIMSERRATGRYNANCLPAFTMGAVLQECKAVSGSDAQLTWVSEEFLLSEKVRAWSELPLWLPESSPSATGLMSVNCDKAISTGLSFRPLRETIEDILKWSQSHPADEWKAGLDPTRERELLRKWHERQRRIAQTISTIH